MWERSIYQSPLIGAQNRDCTLPDRALNLQPRYVPWPGIEPADFWLQDGAPTNWATPARTIVILRRQGVVDSFLLGSDFKKWINFVLIHCYLHWGSVNSYVFDSDINICFKKEKINIKSLYITDTGTRPQNRASLAASQIRLCSIQHTPPNPAAVPLPSLPLLYT